MHKIISAGITLTVLLAIVTGCEQQEPAKPFPKVIIGTQSTFTGYVIFVAHKKGHFSDEGLDVSLSSEYPHGKAALKALEEGAVDFAASSETPFMRAVLNGSEIYAVAITTIAREHLAVVARKDKGIETASDLAGKTIAVTIGSNGEYFMDLVLLLNGYSRDNVTIANTKPDKMIEALTAGKVDAIATWDPLQFKARKLLGDNASVFTAKGIYSPMFIIAAKKEYIDSHPDIAKKVVQALYNSSEFIAANPDEARMIVSEYRKVDSTLLKETEISSQVLFDITLDQSLLVTLEDQTRWAIKNKLTDRTEVPDYLEYIYIDALKEVNSDAVTIIH